MTKSKPGKRQNFLEVFFSTLGACEVLWIYEDEDCIAGTIIYDPFNPDERQDFIWYSQEDKTPDDDVIKVLTQLQTYDLLHMDKLKIPVDEIEIPGLDTRSKLIAFAELFKVKVMTVEDGEETGFYQIHE